MTFRQVATLHGPKELHRSKKGRSTCRGLILFMGPKDHIAVVARKSEHDHPPTPNQRKKENQPTSCRIHIPTLRSLLQP